MWWAIWSAVGSSFQPFWGTICGDGNSKPSWSLQNLQAPGRTYRRCSLFRRRSSPCFEQNLRTVFAEWKKTQRIGGLVGLDYRKTTESLQNASNFGTTAAQLFGLPTMLWDHFTRSKLRETNRKALANLTRMKIAVWKKRDVKRCWKHPKHQRNYSSNWQSFGIFWPWCLHWCWPWSHPTCSQREGQSIPHLQPWKKSHWPLASRRWPAGLVFPGFSMRWHVFFRARWGNWFGLEHVG
jgi:hypothetical protein